MDRKQLKYLEIDLQDSLTWGTHIINIGIGILAKMRHSIAKLLLKSIYYSLFRLYILYHSKILGQAKSNAF